MCIVRSFPFLWICLCAVFTLSVSCVGKNPSHRTSFDFLQSELQHCAESQKEITQFLKIRKVLTGPMDSNKNKSPADFSSRIITSTKDNEVICRVTLDKAPIGSKCIAPCSCTGSQKWVQFSVINKLRRKDPKQWSICQTCREPLMFKNFVAFGGLSGSLIAFIMDYLKYVRIAFGIILTLLGYYMSIFGFLKQFLVSKAFWQMFPQWSKITSLPFALKIWMGKLIVQYFIEAYMNFEKNYVVSYLADLESSIIEKGFPDDSKKNNQ